MRITKKAIDETAKPLKKIAQTWKEVNSFPLRKPSSAVENLQALQQDTARFLEDLEQCRENIALVDSLEWTVKESFRSTRFSPPKIGQRIYQALHLGNNWKIRNSLKQACSSIDLSFMDSRELQKAPNSLLLSWWRGIAPWRKQLPALIEKARRMDKEAHSEETEKFFLRMEEIQKREYETQIKKRENRQAELREEWETAWEQGVQALQGFVEELGCSWEDLQINPPTLEDDLSLHVKALKEFWEKMGKEEKIFLEPLISCQEAKEVASQILPNRKHLVIVQQGEQKESFPVNILFPLLREEGPWKLSLKENGFLHLTSVALPSFQAELFPQETPLTGDCTCLILSEL